MRGLKPDPLRRMMEPVFLPGKTEDRLTRAFNAVFHYKKARFPLDLRVDHFRKRLLVVSYQYLTRPTSIWTKFDAA